MPQYSIFHSNMEKKFAVSRLEEIAFKACYREILSNLLLCPEHSQPHFSVSMYSYSSLISLNLFLTGSNVRRFVRSRLNYHLIGIMNDEIRKKLISEFNENFCSTEQKPDIWVFLDCVLDNSFTELETWVAFPKAEPNEKFVHSICNRSPSIEKLKLNFKTVGKSKLLMDNKLQPIISSLSTLTHLTSLSLYHLKKRHRGILNFIGTSCPKLHHFCITGFRILNEDIFALLLGEKLNQFPDREKVEEKNHFNLKIMPEALSPFCFTLQHLQIAEDLVEEKQKFSDTFQFFTLRYFKSEYLEENGKFTRKLYPVSVSLLLRHMRNLRRIDYTSSISVCSAIKLLHQIPKANPNLGSSHTDISEESKDQTHLRLPSPLMITNSPFSGVLSLTSIDCVNIRDEIMVKAIGRMCPHLKEATFSEWLPHTDAIIPADQLLSILTTEWPKVECVTLMKVSTSYRKAILLGIGPQLSKLTFVDCEFIDVADLILCTELEVLRIFNSSFLLPSENPEEKYFPSGPFLPKLNRLESDICLGSRYSHLFEEKDSLTYLDLACCHVGTKASNISNWNEMTKYWQRLHTLRIRLCTGLTMAGTKSLSLQLTKLKELSLPSWMLNSKDERDISYDLMDYFNKGPLKTHLKFESTKSFLVCPYQDRKFSYYEFDKEISSRESDELSNFGEDIGFDGRSDEESDYECKIEDFFCGYDFQEWI